MVTLIPPPPVHFQGTYSVNSPISVLSMSYPRLIRNSRPLKARINKSLLVQCFKKILPVLFVLIFPSSPTWFDMVTFLSQLTG
jgi:hypothetical protein